MTLEPATTEVAYSLGALAVAAALALGAALAAWLDHRARARDLARDGRDLEALARALDPERWAP